MVFWRAEGAIAELEENSGQVLVGVVDLGEEGQLVLVEGEEVLFGRVELGWKFTSLVLEDRDEVGVSFF